MAWTEVAIPLLRVLVNDLDSSTYTDSRLTDVLISSSYILLTEFDFDVSYTVSIPAQTITPDPENDVDFINLMSLKSAVLIYSGEMKTASNQSFLIKDGPSTIDTQTRAKDIKSAYEEMLGMYLRAKQEFTLGNSRGVQAVLSPYTSSYVNNGNNLR